MKHSYDDGDDPPRDPVVQQWFQSLDPPPEVEDSPGARLRMLAQIDERRGPRWWPSIPAPALAAGLAIGLLLSLGLNLWWGRQVVGVESPPVHNARLKASQVPPALTIYRFQTRMTRSAALGELLAERLPEAPSTAPIGFTPQARRTAFFRLGRLYADVLAALQHTQVDRAEPYLGWLAQTLTLVQAPPQLTAYLEAIRNQLPEQPRELGQWTFLLAGFEVLYRDVYEVDEPSIAWRLFELGAWLENLYLAAAVGDVEAVVQGGEQQGRYRGLEAFHLPPKSLTTLTELQNLIHQSNLSRDDMAAIQRHVETIQTLLDE